MLQEELLCTNCLDENGKPAGGEAIAIGLNIQWQNGPLGRGDERLPANGAFVETVIEAARQRIAWYNEVGFDCWENGEAIYHLGRALEALEARTRRREKEGVEGTHNGS